MEKNSAFYPPSAPPPEENKTLRMPEPPPFYSHSNADYQQGQQVPGAPPPYTPYPQPGPQAPQYPGAYNVPPKQPNAQYGYPPMGPQQSPYPQQGMTTVIQMPVQQGQFDAGARFHPMSPPSIPPPPPGCIPNSAQLSMMQGQPVANVQQKKGGFWKGSGGGGYTFW